MFARTLTTAAAVAAASAVAPESVGEADLAIFTAVLAHADEPVETDLSLDRSSSGAAASGIDPSLFGVRGQEYWGVRASGAIADDSVGTNLKLSYHRFVADDFEVMLSLGGWYHAQDGEDQGSAAIDLGFRWHFFNAERAGRTLGEAVSGVVTTTAEGMGAEDRERVFGGMPGDGGGDADEPWIDFSRMTTYAEIGIGMLFASGEVPEGGTEYNFTPRLSVGVTAPIGDSGARLDAGLGWQHFSNASTAGSDDNPARDGVALYLGVMIPF